MEITLSDTINGVSVRRLIDYNCTTPILKKLLLYNNLTLDKEVIIALKRSTYIFNNKRIPVADQELKLRLAIIDFNYRRKQVIEYAKYLETLIRKELKENIEKDYVECNIELRFGV